MDPETGQKVKLLISTAHWFWNSIGKISAAALRPLACFLLPGDLFRCDTSLCFQTFLHLLVLYLFPLSLALLLQRKEFEYRVLNLLLMYEGLMYSSWHRMSHFWDFLVFWPLFGLKHWVWGSHLVTSNVTMPKLTFRRKFD